MKTLIVSSYPPDRCGIAKYTVQYAADLRRRGEAVDVVSTKPSAARHRADMRTAVGALKVLGLTWRYDRTVIEFFPDLLFRSLRKDRFLLHWPMVALLFGLGKNVELVIHEAPYAAMSRASGLRGLVVRRLWRTLLSLPRRTCVHTAWEREQSIAATGVRPDRITVIDPGTGFIARAPNDRERAREELGIGGDQYRFLAIGFIQPHKGFDRAITALERLGGDDHVHLDIVGSLRVSSPEVDRYAEQLRQMAAGSPRTTLHEGFVSDELFDRWIVAADAVVLPYREIWSSGVLERAKLYGRPAIASDVGGLGDQAGSGTRLVADDEQLAQAMAELAGVELLAAQAPHGAADVESVGDLQAFVHRRAASLRSRYEPVVDATAGAVHPGDLEDIPATDMPQVAGRRGPRALVKRVMARLTMWEILPVLATVERTRGAVNRMLSHDRWVDDRVEEFAARVGALESEMAGTKHWIEVEAGRLDAEVISLQMARGGDRAELLAALGRLREAGSAKPATSPAPPGAPPPAAHAPELDSLYEAHQARFRGRREDIRARVESYVAEVKEAFAPGHPVLDIGPGRGEWLELLKEHGIEAYGVDLNERFAGAAAAAGLDIRQGDGVAHLREVGEGSLSGVTAFHVVEHLPFPDVVDLVDQALRALRPGGILLLETPNPENLIVGATTFYTDPTHLNPVHPSLLGFVIKERGFADVRTLPVNPPSEPPITLGEDAPPEMRRLVELLNRRFFTGLDYAAIGRRPPLPTAPKREAVARRQPRRAAATRS